MGDGEGHRHGLRYCDLLWSFPRLCRGKLLLCWKRDSALFEPLCAESTPLLNCAGKRVSVAKPVSNGCAASVLKAGQLWWTALAGPNVRLDAQRRAGWLPLPACDASIRGGAPKRFMPACASTLRGLTCPKLAPLPNGWDDCAHGAWAEQPGADRKCRAQL